MSQRVIRFRAWNVKLKHHMDDPRHDYLGMAFEERQGSKDYIVEQFTGLTDKNGKEVYEGDIIKSRYGYHEVMWYEDHTPERGGMDDMWETKKSGWFIFYPCEVVGNIHEHRELLK